VAPYGDINLAVKHPGDYEANYPRNDNYIVKNIRGDPQAK